MDEARRELWGRHRALAEKLAADEWEREALYREWADLLKIFDRFTRSIATLGEHSPRSIDAVAALGERFATHLVATALRQAGVSARTVDATELIVTDNHYGAAWPFPAESSEPSVRGLAAASIADRAGDHRLYWRNPRWYRHHPRPRQRRLLGHADRRGAGADQVCIWTDVTVF